MISINILKSPQSITKIALQLVCVILALHSINVNAYSEDIDEYLRISGILYLEDKDGNLTINEISRKIYHEKWTESERIVGRGRTGLPQAA